MAMPGESWVIAIEEEKLADNRPLTVFPKGLPIMLVKDGEQVYALADKCAHMACRLTAGRLFGHIIQCACHDWQFDIRTGESTDAPEIRIATYPLKRENGAIFVQLEAAE